MLKALLNYKIAKIAVTRKIIEKGKYIVVYEVLVFHSLNKAGIEPIIFSRTADRKLTFLFHIMAMPFW